MNNIDPAAPPGSTDWWRDPATLVRLVADIVSTETGRLRPGAYLPTMPWDPILSLGSDGLALDSIERLCVATALSGVFPTNEAEAKPSLLAGLTLGDWVKAVGSRLTSEPPTLGFRTSGSTGEPCLHRHSLSDLHEEIQALKGLVPGRRRVLSTVPAHHIYGFLFTVLLPHALGVPVADVRTSAGVSLAELLQPGDLVVGYPLFWDMFTRCTPTIPANVFGVTASAPCTPDLAARTEAAGLERLLDVYGATETAGIGWREGGNETYRLFPFWRRGDVEGSLLRLRADDTMQVHELPDHLVWADHTAFRVLGRRDDAVQVAGRNVYTARVCAVLRDHVGVADAAVRLMRPDEGVRLKAFIVPRDPTYDTASLRTDLQEWCDTHLAAAERPRAFAFGQLLPRRGLGKPADWPIIDQR